MQTLWIKPATITLVLAAVTSFTTAEAKDTQTAQHSFQNPPLMQINRPDGEQQTPPRQSPSLQWKVDYTASKLWNPGTGRYDNVRLRSYQGTGIDPNAPYVAPMIRIQPGETINATLLNRLPADPSCTDKSAKINTPHCFNGTNMHTHGLWINPAGNSDNVLISINPGVDFQYEYNVPADHPAGTFWYHPHRHGSTALQVASGMAGALIIEGKRPPTKDQNGDIDTLLKPSKAQSFKERVLVFQQIQYACYTKDAKPQIKRNDDKTYRCDPDDVGVVENYDDFGPGGWQASGRYTSINGEIQPLFNDAQAGQIERWRMIHGGVRDSINLQFRKLKDGVQLPAGQRAAQDKTFIEQNCTGAIVPQHLIAADGLTLANIRQTDNIIFQPGYRWDALMLFPEPGQYCVIDADAAAAANVDQTASSGRLLGMVQVGGKSLKGSSSGEQLQAALIDAAKRSYPSAIGELVIADLKNNNSLTRFVQHQSIPPTPNKQTLEFNINNKGFLIDNEPYNPNEIDRKLILGNTDEWTLTSALASHPFHIHVNPFQVVAIYDPNGKDVSAPGAIDDFDKSGPPDTQYPGLKGAWKDTLWVKNVRLSNGDRKTYKVIVRTKYERYIGDFVLHCHILDHEDQGMMQNIRIGLPDGKGGISEGHH
ncbi:MAG TPA: multicopper oxidase family protein [Gammaproteobacteria bacterium]|nr:multicopper oxidase family protein [Gammaproteobacteria bacterium]